MTMGGNRAALRQPHLTQHARPRWSIVDPDLQTPFQDELHRLAVERELWAETSLHL